MNDKYNNKIKDYIYNHKDEVLKNIGKVLRKEREEKGISRKKLADRIDLSENYIGYIEQGKYFVSNHGESSEVSRMIYSISYIWEIIFFLSFPIYFVGLFVISKIQNRIEKRQNMFE